MFANGQFREFIPPWNVQKARDYVSSTSRTPVFHDASGERLQKAWRKSAHEREGGLGGEVKRTWGVGGGRGKMGS